MTDAPPSQPYVLVDALMGAHEVREALSVDRIRFNGLLRMVKTPFPKPIRMLRSGGLWDEAQLVDWAKRFPHMVPEAAPIRAKL